jgi:hypothetical protein
MASELTDFRRIEARMRGLIGWSNENAPECTVEQKHLEEGSRERAYWHYGYAAALRDVIELMTRNLPTNQKSGKSDSSNLYSVVWLDGLHSLAG